jgi:hypothetical protein
MRTSLHVLNNIIKKQFLVTLTYDRPPSILSGVKCDFKCNVLDHISTYLFCCFDVVFQSTQDCVQYYYLSKKDENYKQLLRKSVKKRKYPKPHVNIYFLSLSEIEELELHLVPPHLVATSVGVVSRNIKGRELNSRQ